MHSCTLRCRKETSYSEDLESSIIVLHGFSQTGQPLPRSSSEGKERRLRGPLGVRLPLRPRGWSTQQSGQACASAFRGPALWRPRGPAAPALSPDGDHRGSGCVITMMGCFLPFWKTWNASLFHGRCSVGMSTHRCPVHGHSPCRPPALRARTPQTGSTLKTSLVFGFFVCFEFIQSLRNLWFWLEILKNKTKQRNRPPLVNSNSLRTWRSFCDTRLKVRTTFKEKVKGLGVQLLESPLDIRLSNNNNINNNKNLNIWRFLVTSKEESEVWVCSSQRKGASLVSYLSPKVLKTSRTLRPQRGRGGRHPPGTGAAVWAAGQPLKAAE